MIGCVLFVSFFLCFITYFNNPPQGGAFTAFEIYDLKVDYANNTEDFYSILINGTIHFERIIPDNTYDPTPLKIIIDIKTNETMGIDRKTVSSETLFLNMTLNETYSFSEKLILSEEGSYRVVITIFALQPNNFWGNHWEMFGNEYIFLST